jgi:hypothetical protein
LLQLTLIVALFSTVIRGLINKQNGAAITFSLILIGDLIVFVALLFLGHVIAKSAQKRAGSCIASLAYTREYRRMRWTAYYMTLAASFPYQSMLLAFAANFREMGFEVVSIALVVHAALAVTTLYYWRLARRNGVVLTEQGVLLHGSQFLPWRGFKSFRYSDVRGRLVLYERSQMRFRYHELELPPNQAEMVLELVRPRVELSL